MKRYKERDEESGLYYYGARFYAGWIARFVSVDPLQHKYPHYTPYQYAGNKPISFFDIDGLEEANNEPKTNFYIKKDDTQAKTDIENLAGKSKYIDISATGAVSMSDKFNNLKLEKKQKLLGKNEGLKLIHDLIEAKYTDSNGVVKDANILYQTVDDFALLGIKEPELQHFGLPTIWGGKPGDITVDPKIGPSYILNASITTYGNDHKGKQQPTLLPTKGYQGQVAIAKGDLIETSNVERIIKNNSVNVSLSKNIRNELVKHELRENLFRTEKGMNYQDAHEATVKLYGGGNLDRDTMQFNWK